MTGGGNNNTTSSNNNSSNRNTGGIGNMNQSIPATMITPTPSTNNLNIIGQNCGTTTTTTTTSLAFYDHNDQELMQQENKYRQYALAIDKALKSFEYTSEWADLVNALGKLNRVRRAIYLLRENV